MQVSGCKTLWISLLMAALLMVLVVVMSLKSGPYALRVSALDSGRNGFCRVDGSVERLSFAPTHAQFDLCADGVCIRAEASLEVSGRLSNGRRVIAEGRMENGKLAIERVFTRCRSE